MDSADNKWPFDWRGDLETAPVTVDVKAAAAKPSQTSVTKVEKKTSPTTNAPAVQKLAFGPVTNGLQAAVEVTPGEPLRLRFYVRNGSDREILLAGGYYRHNDECILEDEQGHRVEVRPYGESHATFTQRRLLGPGEVMVFESGGLSLQSGNEDRLSRFPSFKAQAKTGRYTLRFRLHFPDVGSPDKPGPSDWQGELETAPVTVDVKDATTTVAQDPFPTSGTRTIRSVVTGTGQIALAGSNTYNGSVLPLPPVTGQVSAEQAMQAQITKPRSNAGKITKVHTEKDRATIEAQLGEQEVLLVFIGDESLGWSAGLAKPGFGTATIESSSQIRMEDGSMGKGFVAHVGPTTFPVAITPDGPYPFGELVFRADSKVTENNGTYIFADIHKPDGTLVPVCVGVREQDKILHDRTVSNTSSYRGTTNVNASTTNATLAIVAAALRPVLDRLDPKPAIEFPKGDPQSLEVFCLTQKYIIHEKFKSGRVGTNSYEEVGPSHGGFMLRIHVQPKGEVNQAVTPQTLKEPYWLTDLDVTPIAGTDKQIYWALSFAGRSPTNVLSEIRAALKGLEKK